jgi:hypothetical protein
MDEIWLAKTKPHEGKTRNKSKNKLGGEGPQNGCCKRMLFLLVDLTNSISVTERRD